MAHLTRGTSLRVDDARVVGSSRPANLSWRRMGAFVRVEAEAPYKGKGGRARVYVGGLVKRRSYSLYIDGAARGKVRADGTGTASVSLNIGTRHVVEVGGRRGGYYPAAAPKRSR